MRIGPNTSMAAAPGTDFSGLANLMAMKGRGGDNTLVHMSKAELPYLNMLAKSAGYQQGLPVNPETGLPEANILKTILPVAGAILGGMFAPQLLPAFLGKGALATGIGAGLGSFGGSLLSGKSLKDAAIGGLVSGGLSGLGAATFGGQSLMGDTISYTDPAAAALAGRQAAMQAPAINPAQAFGDVGGGAGLTGVDTSAYPLSELSINLDPGISPLYTNPNIQVLSADGTSLVSLPSPYSASAVTTPPVQPIVPPPTTAPSVPPIRPKFTPFTGPTPPAAIDAFTDIGGTGFAGSKPMLGEEATALVKQFFPEGTKTVSGEAAARLGRLPAEAGFTDLGALSNVPEGVDKLAYLKYAAKPIATAGAAGVGVDALLEQGAFEPIDYSSFPQAGEERRASPFDTSGIRFASRRTGAFPRTEEEALAFAQPGGTRRRFFDQGFFTSAKTGGGLADLEVQRFFGGGETGGDDSGPGDADDPGDSGSSVGDDGDGDDGFGGSVGPDDMGDFGAVADAAVAAAIAEANEAAAIADQAMSGPPIGTNPAAFRGSTEDDIEDALFDVEMGLLAPPTIPVDTMDDFGNLSRADIANILGGSFVNPGLSIFGFQTDIGRGKLGGYKSTDQQTQQADIDQGFDTSPVGSFSPVGFVEDVGKTALSVALPGSGLAITAAQEANSPAGTGALGALGNVAATVLGDEDVEDATTKAKGGLLKMAQGGSFLEQMLAGGIGATDKAQDMLKGTPIANIFGKAGKTMSGLLGGASAPMLAEKFMGKPASDITAPPPPIRAMEAPVEAPPPPTDEELEEMQNIAIMQQVLSGAPVEAQAGGLISAYQMGGPPSPYFEGMVKGRGDGMSDSIPFTIEGTQPAILSRDEYVLPADIVSMMGNGSSDAGAEKIDTFINDFRVQKYGRGKQPPETRRGLSGVA